MSIASGSSVDAHVKTLIEVKPLNPLEDFHVFYLLEILIEYLSVYSLWVVFYRMLQRSLLIDLSTSPYPEEKWASRWVILILNIPIYWKIFDSDPHSTHFFLNFFQSPRAQSSIFHLFIFMLLLVFQWVILNHKKIFLKIIFIIIISK